MKIMNETLLGMSTFATSDEQLNCKYNACNLGMDFRFVVVSLKSKLKIEMIRVFLHKTAVLVAIFLLRYFLCYSTNCYKLLLPQHSPDFTKNLNKKCEPLFHIQQSELVRFFANLLSTEYNIKSSKSYDYDFYTCFWIRRILDAISCLWDLTCSWTRTQSGLEKTE